MLPIKTMITWMLIIWILINSAHSIRYYVNPLNTISSGDGLSWPNAFTSLEQAIDVLPATGGAHQIWLIGNQSYTPNTTQRDQCFTFPPGIKIYGGFQGSEKGIQQRPADNIAYETIISGDIGIKGLTSDNCYHVISYDRLLSIDKVTISDGNANYNEHDYHTNQNVTLHRFGGAIMTMDAKIRRTQLFLNQVSLINNEAYNGGALWFTSNPNNQVNITITDCIFENNTAFDTDGSYGGGYGGSLYMSHLAVVSIRNSQFFNNHAQNRGMLEFSTWKNKTCDLGTQIRQYFCI